LTVLIDSWAWIEYFQGSETGRRVRDYLEDDPELIVSSINISEVYRWILRFYDENAAESKREAIKERCVVVDVDEMIAVAAAKIKHQFGWGLGDSIVYATARQLGAEVLTGDSDFKGRDGVIFLEP
jgi:predicted nucleic acid-binding protein